MPPDYDIILRFIGSVIAYGGGGAVVAYGLFRFLGQKWIENKFAERLEQLRHEQAKELQKLKATIDATLSGALKLQDREFEVLPEAWKRLDAAFGRVSELVSPLQQYPDLDRTSDVQLEEFLASSPLPESSKTEIRATSFKTERYKEIIFWHRYREVNRVCADFHTYVASESIFLPPELKDKFTKVAEGLWHALVDKEVGTQAKDFKLQTSSWTKVKETVEPLVKQIGEDIHARLHRHRSQ